MARIPFLDRADLPPEHQDLLSRNINLHRILAHSPNACRAFGGVGKFIRFDSRLDPRLRELAILQVGYLARQPYEWSHHVKIGHDFGVSDADIAGLIDAAEGRPSSLDPLAQAVCRAAREMTTGLAMADDTFQELSAALDTERLTDLVVTIGFYNAVVRVLSTMQIDVEPSYMPYLDAFPLPKN